MTATRTFLQLLSWTLLLCLFTACAQPVPRPSDPLPPFEQLLMSQAIERSIKDRDVGIPDGTAITLDASGLAIDRSLKGYVSRSFVRDVVAGWLGREGLLIREQEKDATFRVRLIIQSLGTLQEVRFIGVPASSGGFFGFATPEVALWKRQLLKGFARLYMDVFEAESGRFVRSVGPFDGSAEVMRYTALLFIRWQKSDMDKPIEQPH